MGTGVIIAIGVYALIFIMMNTAILKMDIYVLDEKAEILDIVDVFQSVIWTVQYYSQGDFELIVPATKKNIDLMQKDRLLCRDKDITKDTFKNVMVIEDIKIESDWEEGDKLTVSGKSLKSIVGRRVVWKQTNLTGNLEAGIRYVLNENVIDPEEESRKIANVELDEVAGITDTIDAQLLGDNIAEWIESICSTHEIGWDMYVRSKKYIFRLYKGTDRTYNQTEVPAVVFSDEYDNLLESIYTYERGDYKNAALIGGEGEGVNQRTTTIGEATGLQRYETYIDGSSVSSNGAIITEEQYYKLLQDYGKEQLNEVSDTESFEGNVVSDGNYKLNQDYFLGDLVQVKNEFGIEATPRIIEIIESEDEKGTAIVPKFSTWEV